MTLVRLEHAAAPSRVKHSTTEPLHSHSMGDERINKISSQSYMCSNWPYDQASRSKTNFLISQPKHMLWVLKRTVPMRQIF